MTASENRTSHSGRAKLAGGNSLAARAAATEASLPPTRAQRRAERRAARKAELAADPKKRRRHTIKRVLLAVACVIAIAAAIVVGFLFWKGALAPGFAAAKYDGMHYITEQEVEDYVASYRKQQGYEDSSDEDWAIYLAAYSLTPETLRTSVIQQLVTTEMVEKAADENDVVYTDEEWAEARANIIYNLALNDEEVYQETIEAQGQSVEEYEEAYRNMLLRQKLYEAVVPVPEATDEETLTYIRTNYTEDTETKHIYYFSYPFSDDEGTYEDLYETQTILDELVEDGVSVENFETMVGSNSEDDDLIETGGAYGWDLDIDDESSAFQEAVEYCEVGEVSSVIKEDDCYSFVYVDTSFTIPAYDASDPYELSDFPESLQAWFAACEAEVLWDDDCNEYLLSLYEDSNCIIYDMPENVDYNVDMDLATEYAEEQMYADEEGATGDDTADEGDSDADDAAADEDDSDAAGDGAADIDLDADVDLDAADDS